jgi:hypothetical protein
METNHVIEGKQSGQPPTPAKPHEPVALAVNVLAEGVCPAAAQVGAQFIVIGGVVRIGTPLHTMLGLEQFG